MFKIKSIVVEQPRSPDGGTIQGNPMTLCDSHPADLIRREFLQVGFCGFLGFGLADLLAGRALAEGVAAAKPSGATAGTRPRAKVNMGRVQTWDTHSANFKTLKERLLPPTDRGVAALLDDLESRGLLDETLVVVTGEFGRTPRIGASTGNNNTRDGPDHWQPSSRPPLPGEAFREARPSAVPTRSALTPPAAPTLRPILPRPSTRASESILPPRSAIA